MPDEKITGFHPQWEREKARLVYEIRNGRGSLEENIDNWFRETVFIYQAENRVPEYELKRMGNSLDDYNANERQRLAVKIGLGICETKGMCAEVTEERMEPGGPAWRVRRLQVLVLGFPSAVQDNSTGAVRPVRGATI